MALRKEMKVQGDYLFERRSYLPVIILILGIYVYSLKIRTLTEFDPGKVTSYEMACFIVSLVGLVIRSIAVGYSSDNTSGRNTRHGQIADDLNITGLYSICRHPLYLGNFFIWLGIAGFTQNTWFIVAFIFMFWIYYERIMFAEEDFLIKKYREKYVAWSNSLPAFLPHILKWRRPKNSFSFKKVIRQEKAGIMYLFLVIFLMKTIGAYATGHHLLIYGNYWFFGAVLGIVWYLIIKTIQKTTKLFDMDR